MKEKWKDLELKTKIAYITALVAFTIGWALTIAGFIIGGGVISDSVLWVLGQALVYAASVFGVGMYVSHSMRDLKRGIRNFMREEDRRFHNGRYEDYGETYEEEAYGGSEDAVQ